MASSSSSQSSENQAKLFQFNKLKLPKVDHVIEYVTSRTSKHLSVSQSQDHSTAVHRMAMEVHDIWAAADCPPKSVYSIKKMFEKMILQRKVLRKKNKKYEIRKLEESVFDVLADEKNRSGLVFDIAFYDEQRISWQSRMEATVNPIFEEEAEEDMEIKKAKQKKIRGQYSNFEVADSSEVDRFIHQVCFKTYIRSKLSGTV